MEIWNNIALLSDDTHFTPWVKEAGRLDHDYNRLLKHLAPYLHGTILDLGANIGTHTKFYLQHGDVIAIEANPRAFACLQHNCPEATNFNMAVGATLGTVDICEPDKNYGAAYTIPGNTVFQTVVDALPFNNCDFIKIDVEGDEIAALQGARDTINRYKPNIFIEVNDITLKRKGKTRQDLYNLINSLGYYVRKTFGSAYDEQFDVLLLPI